jgi:hypothetical protein
VVLPFGGVTFLALKRLRPGDIWLNEGLVTCAEWLYTEQHGGHIDQLAL